MYLKNIHIIVAFLTIASFVLSFSIQYDEKKIGRFQWNSNKNEENISSSDEEEVIVTPTDIGIEIDNEDSTYDEELINNITTIKPTSNIQQINDDLSYFEYRGDYYLDDFIARNGTADESEFFPYLINRYSQKKLENFQPSNDSNFACSSFSVQKKDGNGFYFGRNFDYQEGKSTIVVTYPEDGKSHASISTVLNNFILTKYPNLPEEILKLICIYIPLDGMNDKGLTVSVNMVYGRTVADQNTSKPDITLSTAVRLLLDRAATVDEAFEILKSYDMHAGATGIQAHIAITDASGKAIVVEYIDNEIEKIEDPINENFYLYDNFRKNVDDGNGNIVDHLVGVRYDIIKERMEEIPKMSFDNVKETLILANQCNSSNAIVKTEWSVIYDKSKKEAVYYHRCNYENGFNIVLDHE